MLNTLRKGYAGVKLKVGVDYEVRRYVDDYFIYANSEKVLKSILAAYKEQLESYKLFINESKLQFNSRPYGSDKGDAKRAISQMINKFKERYLQKDESSQYKRQLRDGYHILLDVAKEIRSITHQFNLQYGDANKYTLKLLMYQIVAEMKSKAVPSLGLLLSYVDVGFYLFSLDMNASASYKICRIVDYLMTWSKETIDSNIKVEVENRIVREAKRCMDIYQAQMGENDTNLEMLNLLLTLKQTTSFNISERQLQNVFGLDSIDTSTLASLNYFQICTLLFLVGNDNDQYPLFKKKLVEAIELRLDSKDIFKKADTTMLFFDIMVCPYIEKKSKNNIIRNCLLYTKEETIGVWVRKFNKIKRWFFDWDETHNISFFLDKKEYHSPYE